LISRFKIREAESSINISCLLLAIPFLPQVAGLYNSTQLINDPPEKGKKEKKSLEHSGSYLYNRADLGIPIVLLFFFLSFLAFFLSYPAGVEMV
jgi:hypothetical protein